MKEMRGSISFFKQTPQRSGDRQILDRNLFLPDTCLHHARDGRTDLALIGRLEFVRDGVHLLALAIGGCDEISVGGKTLSEMRRKFQVIVP